MHLYRITDWGKHFENNRTRDLHAMAWVPVPNRMDGDGYTELVGHENGAAHLGAWLAIIEVASRCAPRGTLLREGARPHDAGSLSRLSRLPAQVFDEVLPRLIEIGWVELIPIENQSLTDKPQASAVQPQADAPSRACVERKGMERNGMEQQPCAAPAIADEQRGSCDSSSSPSTTLTFPVVAGKNSKHREWQLTEEHFQELVETFPALDVRQQCREALAWLNANPGRRKTASGMARFLFGWMERRQNGNRNVKYQSNDDKLGDIATRWERERAEITDRGASPELEIEGELLTTH